MALIERSFGGDGTYETIVQGIDRRGSATWRRRLPVEAGVTAHPFGPYIGLSDGTTFVLLDATGREVRRLDGVRTAAFTADGELMTVTSDDAVEWLPSDHFPQ